MVVNLGSKVSISEYAFWLINRARFGTLDQIGSKNFELLLVIDPEGQAAALTAGYGLENYLSEEDLKSCLAAGNHGFRSGDLAGGIEHCVEGMMDRLREIALRIEKASTTAETTDISTTTTEIR